MRILVKVLSRTILVFVIFVALLLAFLTVAEYRPDELEDVFVDNPVGDMVVLGASYRFMTFNIGYAGLGKDEDFVLDGGEKGRPNSKDVVEGYLEGILGVLSANEMDFYLLQEVDLRARRSYNINQVDIIHSHLGDGFSSMFALNFKALFVPFPISLTDYIGHVESGLQTLSSYGATRSERHQFPGSFSWPLRVANLKRAMLVTYIDIEGSDKQLVVANLHMSAYDGDGSLRAQEMAYLHTFMVDEAAKGNYVVMGGDFNQTFPGADIYPPRFDFYIAPVIEASFLPDHFTFAFDPTYPTCRLLNQPYDPSDAEGTQYYIIDGFIVSDNIRIDMVATLNLGFEHSDHNPVVMTVTLLNEEA